MYSGMVAVWDTDREYAEKLSEYLRRQGGLGSSVVSFAELQRLRQAVEHRQAAVVLAGEEAAECSWIAPIPTIFLTKQAVTEKDPLKPKETKGHIYVYKYQPARQLLYRLSDLNSRRSAGASEQKQSVPALQERRSPARIRGIYSPLGGCLKTSLGLVMGCLLAEEKRCLFVSLEAHSGFRTLLGRQYPIDLADLFAAIRQGGDLAGILTEALQPFGKLSYIPPVIWPVDIREAEFSELKELLQRLAVDGGFDEIIVDVGRDLARPERILSLCDQIYRPEKEDIFSRAKLAEYDCYLRISGCDGISQRTIRIPVSQLEDGMGASSLDQWQRWEQMLPVVRRILKEAGDDGTF